uniref:Uncharacterized protein n=1 Tax=Vespula pensylvanica TaxID=30213 RepID=A0A834PG32_VESPE|nr:hypothetical protein H0235_001544 [Vespula pensylvanica]
MENYRNEKCVQCARANRINCNDDEDEDEDEDEFTLHHQIFIDRVDVEPAVVASSITTTTTMKESSRHRRETLFLQASNGYRSTILGAFSTLESCEGMRSPRENSEGKAGYRCRLRWLVTWNDAWVAIGRMQIENQYPLVPSL